MFKCIVNADLFRRAASCQSTEQARFYLCGVYVERCPAGGAILVATDGRKMVVIRDPSGYVEGSAIVSLSKEMLKACKAPSRRYNSGPAHVVIDQGKAAVTPERFVSVYPVANRHNGARDSEAMFALATAPDSDVLAHQFAAVTVDGSFPDWRRVVPQGDNAPGPVGAFNAEFLAMMGDALCTDKTKSVQIVCTGDPASPLNPHLVFGSRDIEGFGVLMPLRADMVRSVPAWIDSRVASENVIQIKTAA